jgi:5-methylcytosine-specific restriction protein B
MTTPTADDVRAYVFTNYIAPARQRGDATVRIVAGDVHRALGFSEEGSPRASLVCRTLGAKSFRRDYNVILRSREGPGIGMTTVFIFEV